MSATPIPTTGPGDSSSLTLEREAAAQGVIAWSSLAFAILQGICTAVVAINGLRLAIGLGALVMTAGIGADLVHFHMDWIRIPMIVAALLGSLLSLAIYFHIRYLRKRPASRWRQVPLSPSKARMERIQLILSLATLVLLGIEESLHFSLHHKL